MKFFLSQRDVRGSILFKDKILCICFGIVLSLVFLEILLRLLGFGYNLYYHSPVDRNAGFRIFCIGESTTWGIGATDPVLRGYPQQLEQRLKRKFPQKSIQCLFENAIGQNTSEILIKLPKYIRKHQPQMVILMVGANNVWNMDSSNILLFGQTPLNRMCFGVMIFLDKFRVWKLLKNIYCSSGLYRERWNYYLSSYGPMSRIEAQDKRIGRKVFDELAEHDIEEMIRILKANKIEVLMCSYPMGEGELYYIKKKLSQKYEIPFADNFSVFQSLFPLQDYLWTDGWHPNDRGYVVLAETIYNVIVTNRMIE